MQRLFAYVVSLSLLVASAVPASAGPSLTPPFARGNPGLVRLNLIAAESAMPATVGVITSNSLPPLQNIVAIAAGGWHTCALNRWRGQVLGR